ncbi:hypothetical protein [Muriicola sp. Z0-33]|uniref:hypothetical protein n=1 Tax=Muriicola sp. Z0-33 TaxID=2816957 RepID=UPI002238AC5F|nr:hypothetical protein [Muriicola sp. Z0-33]MCW5517319.1 hypothetical protein [Muriicola sp. Z0-33]
MIKKTYGSILSIACLLVLFFAGHMPVLAQDGVIELTISKGNNLLARITVPEGFSKDKAYPVVLGPGLDGGDLKAGCRYFGSNKKRHGWILVESLVHMEKRSAVKVLLDYLEENYATSGIYILGFSANSIDAFQIAEQYKDRFAGVIGMPGNPGAIEQKLNKYSNTKILMIAGERDTYWKNRAVKAKKKLDASRVWNNLIIVPNGGHILDEYAGAPLFKAMNALLDK